MKRALIFGMSGQAGYYLARLLRSKNYEVHGTYCQTFYRGSPDWWYRVDLTNQTDREVEKTIESVKPDEIYNLASSMFAPASWDHPVEYMQVNALAVTRMLETFRKVNPSGRFFQAGSADVFDLKNSPQNEQTMKKPRTPYGVAKLAAQESVRVYREHYGMFACTGILFNMESPRRSKTFFTTKVAQQVVQLIRKERTEIVLGRLTAVRDWGRTEEYVKAMWLMLNGANIPRDYVIGTGQSATCVQFVREAMELYGLDSQTQLQYEKYQVPLDQDHLCADPKQIYIDLRWRADCNWKDVVKELVEAELGKSVAA